MNNNKIYSIIFGSLIAAYPVSGASIPSKSHSDSLRGTFDGAALLAVRKGKASQPRILPITPCPAPPTFDEILPASPAAVLSFGLADPRRVTIDLRITVNQGNFFDHESALEGYVSTLNEKYGFVRDSAIKAVDTTQEYLRLALWTPKLEKIIRITGFVPADVASQLARDPQVQKLQSRTDPEILPCPASRRKLEVFMAKHGKSIVNIPGVGAAGVGVDGCPHIYILTDGSRTEKEVERSIMKMIPEISSVPYRIAAGGPIVPYITGPR